MSPKFLYQASLMEKRLLAMQMRSCEDKLKGKTAHFRLPSASQKRACLSSLISGFTVHTLSDSLRIYLFYFMFFHSGGGIQKYPDSLPNSPAACGRKPYSEGKSCGFKKYPGKCGRSLRWAALKLISANLFFCSLYRINGFFF